MLINLRNARPSAAEKIIVHKIKIRDLFDKFTLRFYIAISRQQGRYLSQEPVNPSSAWNRFHVWRLIEMGFEKEVLVAGAAGAQGPTKGKQVAVHCTGYGKDGGMFF